MAITPYLTGPYYFDLDRRSRSGTRNGLHRPAHGGSDDHVKQAIANKLIALAKDESGFGAALLHETEAGVEHDDEQDGDGVAELREEALAAVVRKPDDHGNDLSPRREARAHVSPGGATTIGLPSAASTSSRKARKWA